MEILYKFGSEIEKKKKCTFQEILICSMEPNTKWDYFFIFQNVRKKKILINRRQKIFFQQDSFPDRHSQQQIKHFTWGMQVMKVLLQTQRIMQKCCRPCLNEHYAITPMKLWLDGPENNNTNNLIIVRAVFGWLEKKKHKMFDRICSLALILQSQLFCEQHFQ